jgi:hypothetical protein
MLLWMNARRKNRDDSVMRRVVTCDDWMVMMVLDDEPSYQFSNLRVNES